MPVLFQTLSDVSLITHLINATYTKAKLSCTFSHTFIFHILLYLTINHAVSRGV